MAKFMIRGYVTNVKRIVKNQDDTHIQVIIHEQGFSTNGKSKKPCYYEFYAYNEHIDKVKGHKIGDYVIVDGILNTIVNEISYKDIQTRKTIRTSCVNYQLLLSKMVRGNKPPLTPIEITELALRGNNYYTELPCWD